MANYYGTARSNYFRVKDEAAFREAMEPLDVEIVTHEIAGEKPEVLFGVLGDNGDGAGFSSAYYTDDDDEVEYEIAEEIAKHLADGEVAVFMEAGAEKMRYVIGWATAINNKGERRDIGLRDIYDLAAELGPNVTAAEY